MFRHQIYESFIIDDIHALDQRSVTQAPRSNIGTQDIKRKIFHPPGNFFSVGSVFQGRVNTILYQQDRTPGFCQAKTAIQGSSLKR